MTALQSHDGEKRGVLLFYYFKKYCASRLWTLTSNVGSDYVMVAQGNPYFHTALHVPMVKHL